MMNFLTAILTTSFLFAAVRVTTPILYAGLSATVANRVGAPNIGIEGMMLMSALMGVVFSDLTQNVWLGGLAGILTGGLLGLLLAFVFLKLKVDIVLGGVALNLMASGGTIFILYSISGDKGSSTSLSSKVFPTVKLPLIDKIPVIGEIFSNHNLLTYIAILMAIAIYFLMNKTKLGLRIRATGENPLAVQSVGVNVNKIYYLSLFISGILAGLGGIFMSMAYVSWFSADMVAGRGFIALAAAALAKDRALYVIIPSFIFGFADAFANSIHSASFPVEYIQMTPYIATILGLLIYSLRRKRLSQNT